MPDIVRFDKFNLLVELEQTYIKLATTSSDKNHKTSKEEHKNGRRKREEEKGRGRGKIIWKARKLLLRFKPDLRRKKEKSSQSKGTSNGDKKLPISSTT